MAQPTTTKQGLRDYLFSISPPWLQAGTSPGPFGVGGRLMYAFGLLADASLEKLDQAMRAHMPGYCNPTALPILGDDRVLVQAPGESNASFTLRLKSFIRDWSYAGSNWALLEQMRFYVQPYLPLIRIVSNSGAWDWFESQAANATSTGTWNKPNHYQGTANFTWDNLASTAWWRIWAILYPGLSVVGTAVTAATNASPIAITTSTAHGLSTGNQVCIDNVHGNLAANGYWVVTVTSSTTFTLNGSVGSGAFAAPNGVAYLVPSTTMQTANAGFTPQVIGPAPFVFGSAGAVIGPNVSATSPQGSSIGLNVPSSWFNPLRVLQSQWKAAHAWLRWNVFCFNTSLFSPWSSSTPAGNWQYAINHPVTIRTADGVV